MGNGLIKIYKDVIGTMSWFRISSYIFSFWAVVFLFFPGSSNEIAGIGYVLNGHAEDWTQIIGLFSGGFAVLLNTTHCSSSVEGRRIVARSVLSFTFPCALLMTYWQIIPDRLWFRLDIINIALLFLISYGMFWHGYIKGRRRLKPFTNSGS